MYAYNFSNSHSCSHSVKKGLKFTPCYQIATQNWVRKYEQICNLIYLKAFDQIESSHQSDFLSIFLYDCAICSELPSNKSTFSLLPKFWKLKIYTEIVNLLSPTPSPQPKLHVLVCTFFHSGITIVFLKLLKRLLSQIQPHLLTIRGFTLNVVFLYLTNYFLAYLSFSVRYTNFFLVVNISFFLITNGPRLN